MPACQSALQPWVSLGLLYIYPSSSLSILSPPSYSKLSTSSNHLLRGLPFLLLEYSLPFNILFGIALSSILSTYPNHLILCDLINITISSPFVSRDSAVGIATGYGLDD
jgi:hypothetical protein